MYVCAYGGGVVCVWKGIVYPCMESGIVCVRCIMCICRYGIVCVCVCCVVSCVCVCMEGVYVSKVPDF